MVVQPRNQGTLRAILWSLLRIVRLDKGASVAIFPSDHYYAKEEKFMAGIASAFDLAEANTRSVILLGAVATHQRRQVVIADKRRPEVQPHVQPERHALGADRRLGSDPGVTGVLD